MSMADIRAAFKRAAGTDLRLDHLALRYQNNGQVIDATGWHADETPFAFVSEAFRGDPQMRAAEIAHDLIRAHSGKPPKPPVQGPVMTDGVPVEQLNGSTETDAHGKMMALVEMFDSGLKALEQDMDALMTEFPGVLKDAEDNTGKLRTHIERIKKGTAAMRDFNNRMSNMPKA